MGQTYSTHVGKNKYYKNLSTEILSDDIIWGLEFR
jgi:hypothetical protein